MQFVTIDQYIIYGTIVILMFAAMRRMHVTAICDFFRARTDAGADTRRQA